MPYIRSFAPIIAFFIALTSLLSAQSEFKYSYFPKKIYQNQIFPVTVIGISTSNAPTPTFSFDPNSNVQPLSEKPLVIKNNNDSFYTFYFKAQKNDIKVPALRITLGDYDTVLPSGFIPLKALEPNGDFCGVIAADMKVKNAQVSNYDERNHIVTLNIEANEANLEDMKLGTVEENGIEEIVRDNAKVFGDFYAILPTEQKELKFTYFNTIKHEYVTIQTSVEVKDASVATHTELNPKDDSFEQLKKFTLVTLMIFMFIMFLFKRDFFFLVLGVISFITLLTLYIPHKTICVKQGSPLYILPTHTSTVSVFINKELETSHLGERGDYIKVETDQGIIGWIKNEDLCEN